MNVTEPPEQHLFYHNNILVSFAADATQMIGTAEGLLKPAALPSDADAAADAQDSGGGARNEELTKKGEAAAAAEEAAGDARVVDAFLSRLAAQKLVKNDLRSLQRLRALDERGVHHVLEAVNERISIFL